MKPSVSFLICAVRKSAHHSAALPVFFCALCAALLWPLFPALGAALNWQALPDRERVTITMAPTEGMAGKIARIAPNGVLIPFSDVPPGLLVNEAPQGAAIFQSTRQQGRSLVLVTRHPEFGFVVSKQTPTELAVDFFHNALGARWKPTSASPTTELAPTEGLGPIAAEDDVSRTLESDPSGASRASADLAAAAATAPALEQLPAQAAVNATMVPAQPAANAAQAPAQPAANATQSPAQPVAQAEAGAAQAPARPDDPDRPKPVVVQLSGTPEHASTATRMAEAPPAEVPSSALLPRPGAGNATAGERVFPPAQPLLEARTQTAERAAPLPVPEPPLTSLSGSSVTGLIDFSATPESPPVQAATPPAPQTSAQTATPPAQPAAASAQRDAASGGDFSPERESAGASGSGAAPALPPRVPGAARQAGPEQTAVPAQPETAAAPTATPTAAPTAQNAVPPPGVGVSLGDSAYGGSINTGGPEDISWSGATPATANEPSIAESARQTFAPQTPPSAPADRPAAQSPPASAQDGPTPQPPSPGGAESGAPPSAPGAPGQTNATVIYTDAEGNPVEPPPDPLIFIPQILEHIKQGKFQDALDLADLLLEKSVLTKEQKEELLHIRAEMLFAVHKDDLAGHYREISDAAVQAMSFNPKSRRNAADLLRLGYMNLKLNNIPEAEARFNMLRRLYPDDENVPLTYYYWGDYHFGRNELQRAADEFQFVLQEHPNSRIARESALGLARSFYRMGYYDQAFNVVDYIERRWERFYVQYPPFLNMMGDVAFRLNRLDYALSHYWLYVNLEPAGAEADIIFTRMGDIYAMQREKDAAQELYRESMNRFPDRDGGLVAMMRLAEEGMNDDPTIAGMFAVFDGPFSLKPAEVYRRIVKDHPQSSLVPLAEVKLALWHLWNKEYEQTLDVLSDFIGKYPEHELVPRVREIAMQTFAVLSAESMQDERYGRMREVWERYPVVRDQDQAMSPESRIALGVSYRDSGDANQALRVVQPFFLGNKIPEYSEMALSLVLSIYLEHNQWEAVREVARRVDLWELKPESKMQLDYALALAAENLGEPEKAGPIWQRLYDSGKLPASQMAYAAFFLAREAERERQLEKAFLLGQEALSRLISQVERSPNAADIGKIQTQLASLMDVAESAGRMNDALRYGEQYLQYLDENNPERLAVRYRMARVYKKLGDTDNWTRILEDIVSTAPGTVYGQLAASELKAASIAEDAAKYSPTGRL